MFTPDLIETRIELTRTPVHTKEVTAAGKIACGARGGHTSARYAPERRQLLEGESPAQKVAAPSVQVTALVRLTGRVT